MTAALTVYQALGETVRRRRTAPALICGRTRVTYEELIARVDQTAAVLREMGLGHGDAFAVYAQNCPELLYCYYAAAKLGAVYVPINPNMTAAEVKYIFSHCEAKRLFHDAAAAEAAAAAVPAESRQAMSALSRKSDRTARVDEAPVAPNDDFLIIYTSGSTGAPKAVVLDHAAQVNVCESLIELWGISDQDVTLVALPLGYLYGLSTAAAAGLRAGGMVAILPKFRPGTVLEALSETRASIFHGVPTMFSMMLEYSEQNHVSCNLSHVRLMISAGAPLPDEVGQRFARTFGKELQNYYALTECTPIFGRYAQDPIPPPPSAIGKKAPGAAVRVIGPGNREVGPGVEGELHVRGAATLKYYRGDPQLTASALQDGWFKSGDIGWYDEQGYYYISGRIKDVIIRGGSKISPAEVEGILSRHPAVHEVAVVGIADRIYGEVPMAFVVRRSGWDVSAEELIKHAESELADFKVPRHYSFQSSLPLGKTGKVDKSALKSQWQAQGSRGGS
jgi:long-chain acyl-CoA synthetase